jgi:hypothetical protein
MAGASDGVNKLGPKRPHQKLFLTENGFIGHDVSTGLNS